jgi:hypothetical protein
MTSQAFTLLTLYLCLFALPIHAQSNDDNNSKVDEEVSPGVTGGINSEDFVSYPASFFSRFQPITALDMVEQIPGFQLEDVVDEEVRGFSSNPGNILIDDRRPSAKQDSLAAILARIPADMVERIELIRGQVRNIDMRGESAVVNLVLRRDSPASIQWEAHLEHRFGFGFIGPFFNVSYNDRWRDIEFNVGLEGKHEPAGRFGTDEILDSTDTLTEIRFDERQIRNHYLKGNFNAATSWNDTLLQLNSSLQYDKDHVTTISDRVPQVATGLPRQDIVKDFKEGPGFEAGLDAERALGSNLTGKAILLFNGGHLDLLSTQRNINESDFETLFREADSRVKTEELISRLEFDWTGISNHLIQANMERAHNSLDSRLRQTDDTGTGPVEVIVPGANSKVEEERWDLLIKDTWNQGKLEIEFGVGAEASTITQTGDAVSKRNFFFIKPQTILNYSTGSGYLTRLKLAKEVSQLDLDGFVSATVFDEDDLALGNPDIRPDTTWILELNQEYRFGSDGALKLTAFHHWVSDVLDLLPITSDFEAPGNIGNGRRWGLILDMTLPLDILGLTDAKINIKNRWQDSIVTDPVTGLNRVMSLRGSTGGGIRFLEENKYAVFVNFRQDFREARIAWGWTLMERAQRPVYKVNELELYNEGIDITTFIETTRWFGIKMQLSAENILNFEEQRDRTVFEQERDLSPLISTQLRRRTRGAQLFFTMSGVF